MKMQKEAEIHIIELSEYYAHYKQQVKEVSKDVLQENICNSADAAYRQQLREMWLRNETIKRKKAEQKVKWLEKERRYRLGEKASYWDEYRELRLKLVTDLVVVLKAKKFAKELATLICVYKAAK